MCAVFIVQRPIVQSLSACVCTTLCATPISLCNTHLIVHCLFACVCPIRCALPIVQHLSAYVCIPLLAIPSVPHCTLYIYTQCATPIGVCVHYPLCNPSVQHRRVCATPLGDTTWRVCAIGIARVHNMYCAHTRKHAHTHTCTHARTHPRRSIDRQTDRRTHTHMHTNAHPHA